MTSTSLSNAIVNNNFQRNAISYFHNSKLKPIWAITTTINLNTFMVVDICEHKLGHPNRHWCKPHTDANITHECDSCCKNQETTHEMD